MLNLSQVFNFKLECFHINKYDKLNVGMNVLSNRLYFLNDQIPVEWLTKPYSSFKIEVNACSFHEMTKD
jgi:hypothetical protein